MLFTLGLAGMLSGTALVGIYELTAPRIERNRAEALEAAIHRVLPGTTTNQAYGLVDGALVPLETEEGRLPKGEAVYEGIDADGRRVGFAIPAEGGGFQDTIKLIYGVDPQRRRVVGMEILESKETPGLGDKIFKDESFVAEFSDLAVDPEIKAVKPGAGVADNEVDTISGATISSKAVVNIINDGNGRWLDVLPTDEAP